MYYENVYTNYRRSAGCRFRGFHQHQDYDDGAHLPNVSGGDHAFGSRTGVGPAGERGRDADRAERCDERPRSAGSRGVTTVGDGVWLIAGGSHHSVAVEFGDYVVVIEAPLNEARSLAVIGEVNRLMPSKPIRFIVTTHHHWDHLGGLRAYVHEGATVITHESNKPYYQEVLRAGIWTLEPDRFSLYPPEEWSEGYIFETLNQQYVLADDTQRVELYTVQGLAHAAGMLIGISRVRRSSCQADLYTSGADDPQRQRPLVSPQPAAAESRCGDHRGDTRQSRADVAVHRVHGCRAVTRDTGTSIERRRGVARHRRINEYRTPSLDAAHRGAVSPDRAVPRHAGRTLGSVPSAAVQAAPPIGDPSRSTWKSSSIRIRSSS